MTLSRRHYANLESKLRRLRGAIVGTFAVAFLLQLSMVALSAESQAIATDGSVVQPTGIPSADLPGFGGSSAQSAAKPSDPPSDLAGLSKKLTQSVVTVFCDSGNDLGSGWAANVTMTPSMKEAGYHSYIITNLHVVAACTSDPTIHMTLSNGQTINGKVWAWSDTDHDVAGIVTNATLPTLSWRGKLPAQGWWVGVIGSPLGQPGLLSTGIISSVALAAGGPNNFPAYTGTTTAPINHGNSGGPVFDSGGRVLGLATAVLVDTQNIGIFNGTPMLCDVVVSCSSQSQVWGDGQLVGSGSTNLKIFVAIGVLIVIGAGLLIFFVVRKQGNSDSFKSPRDFSSANSFKPAINPNLPTIPPSSLGAPPPPPRY
jgi:S1-C subfamily serine protease